MLTHLTEYVRNVKSTFGQRGGTKLEPYLLMYATEIAALIMHTRQQEQRVSRKEFYPKRIHRTGR